MRRARSTRGISQRCRLEAGAGEEGLEGGEEGGVVEEEEDSSSKVMALQIT